MSEENRIQDGEQETASTPEVAPENEPAKEEQQPADDQRSGEPSTSLPENENKETAEEGEKEEGEEPTE